MVKQYVIRCIVTLLISTSLIGILYSINLKKDIEENQYNIKQAVDDYEKRINIADNSFISQYLEEYSITQYNTSKNEKKAYIGEIDAIVIIDKINMKYPIISGGDMDYNLSKYFFVTGKSDMTYGTGDYVILGHQSRVYGHSFNRLEEVTLGDTITIMKNNVYYNYDVIYVGTITDMNEVTYNKDGITDNIILLTCVKSKSKNKPYIIVKANLHT